MAGFFVGRGNTGGLFVGRGGQQPVGSRGLYVGRSGASGNGRVHRHMAQRRLNKQGVPTRFGMGKFVAPIGIVGLIGAGLIGYSMLNKNGKWRSLLPQKSLITAPSVVAPSTTITTPVAAPIVHNRKVPLKERLLSKATKRPVITNYH